MADRKGGDNSLQRWHIVAATVVGILGVAFCFILSKENISFILIGGMLCFVGFFLIVSILIGSRKARDCTAETKDENDAKG